MAIELDGDAFRGPEKWDDDMARQAVLERAGWVFWRVFGSQWEQAKERWWSDLLDTLTRMQIEPNGAEPINGAIVEYRTVEVGASSKNAISENRAQDTATLSEIDISKPD